MKHVLTWSAILGLPVLILGTLWFARRDPTVPNVILPTNMAVSPALRSQGTDASLPLGVEMQLPPDGTLKRDGHMFRYGPSLAERQRAGRELHNPLPPTPEVIARGKLHYETFCLPCHGVAGNGDGPLIPKYPNPPSFRSKQTKALSDGEMFHTLTLGWKKMASYASQLDWNERWEVIRYVRTLQAEVKR